jgi:hypothetical protein
MRCSAPEAGDVVATGGIRVSPIEGDRSGSVAARTVDVGTARALAGSTTGAAMGFATVVGSTASLRGEAIGASPMTGMAPLVWAGLPVEAVARGAVSTAFIRGAGSGRAFMRLAERAHA